MDSGGSQGCVELSAGIKRCGIGVDLRIAARLPHSSGFAVSPPASQPIAPFDGGQSLMSFAH